MIEPVIIGDCQLYNADCLDVMARLEPVSHVISDPPYEESTHKNIGGIKRNDGGHVTEKLDFASIDGIRGAVVQAIEPICTGWAILFCTTEGVARWADVINPSKLKYKRACAWIKPDAMPQMNGQGPANGLECFVVSWNGKGHAKWNAGGKRGVYTHLTNQRIGLAHAGISPYGVFKTRDGRDILISIQNEREWKKLWPTPNGKTNPLNARTAAGLHQSR